MIWLVLGILIWSGVHFIPSIGQSLKAKLTQSIGENGYKGAFALSVLAGLALIVFGWRSTDPSALYYPPAWTAPVATVLMIVSFVLFGAANMATRIKQFLRHPQLTGLVLWSVAHLIANGDTRSLVLFGGLGLWALVEMRLINAREGEWVKPEAPTMAVELRGLAISLVIFAAAFFLHPYFAGVPIMPG